MIRIPGGPFLMGSESYYPEEAPVFRATVAAFELDKHPVTNRQFSEFTDATGYVTVAERPLDAAEFPQLSVAERAAGSLAFHPTDGPVDLRNWRAWWAWQPGANWRHPFGPDSDISDRGKHPVVQVCFADAAAYARWAGKRLPTEVEWERAARGGVDGRDFAWGDELSPNGQLLANTWQGSFPYRNTGASGWVGTSPVGSFPANEFGLVDMIGNVWEWTSTAFTTDHQAQRAATANLLGASTQPSAGAGCGDGCMCGPSDSGKSGLSLGSAPNPAVSRVTKGGSHLCAPEYCQRYRPAARSPQTEDSATTHLGFRCARDA
ncbi:formylglycine-generating enzyme family protein [Mycetocola zhadangensis]|uniref:Formylglycine-generating enzyme family protein n=2 Tax=Mycetocola zhadangensis TaxID=1164595 RepID=A0A3L7J5A5_9MICO|nr:formylglycine-generating enzyme family protein [Mycetocola zhadangensis]RLQ84661.1 formylglycine-generating enzyme family protein [Mycetocola zhadangensis]